jgi:hypothetical protein
MGPCVAWAESKAWQTDKALFNINHRDRVNSWVSYSEGDTLRTWRMENARIFIFPLFESLRDFAIFCGFIKFNGKSTTVINVFDAW